MASVEMQLAKAPASSSEGSGVRSHVPLALHPVLRPPAATAAACPAAGGGEGSEDSPYSVWTATPRDEISPSKWSDLGAYSGRKKIKAWCLLSNGDWALGTILSTSEGESVISLPEGKRLKVDTETLLPANPSILDGVDDLMQLSYLNELSVLYNLQHRYARDMIYTKAGPVLVAINPFKDVHLYGNDFIEAYRRKAMENPYVYAIADTTIREMTRDEINQSIIIRSIFIGECRESLSRFISAPPEKYQALKFKHVKIIWILNEHFGICYISIHLTDFELHFSFVSANSKYQTNSST